MLSQGRENEKEGREFGGERMRKRMRDKKNYRDRIEKGGEKVGNTNRGGGGRDGDYEMTPSEAGIEDHELQEILDREYLDLENFLKQGKNITLNSLPKEDYDRVQHLFLWRSQSRGARVKRNHEI